MTDRRPEKRLTLINLDISKQELIQLLEPYDQIGHVVRHDIGNKLSIAQVSLHLAFRHLKEMENQLASKDLNPEVDDKVDRIDQLYDQATRNLSSAHGIIEILFPGGPLNSLQGFVTRPYFVLQQVRPLMADAVVSLTRESPRSLEIIYPESIFGAILHEMINNAVKHGNKKCKVSVAWRVEQDRFRCEIHDNGKGIISNLGETFLTISDVSSNVKGSTRGISIVARLLQKSRGNLLYSRSLRLGGTCASIDFPVMAYYLGGHVYDCIDSLEH